MAINYLASIKIRDFRNGDWFWISKHIWQDRTLTASDKVVYGTLAFFANQSQLAWPSLDQIASFSDISRRQVYRSTKRLEFAGYLSVKRHGIRGKPNEYRLLKTKGDNLSSKKIRGTKRHKLGGQLRGTNSTSINNNITIRKNNIYPTIKKPTKYSSLKNISNEDISEIATKYKVSVGFVQLQLEKLTNYCEAKGKRYKNYKSALRNFVLGDIQRNIERNLRNDKRGVDARDI